MLRSIQHTPGRRLIKKPQIRQSHHQHCHLGELGTSLAMAVETPATHAGCSTMHRVQRPTSVGKPKIAERPCKVRRLTRATRATSVLEVIAVLGPRPRIELVFEAARMVRTMVVSHGFAQRLKHKLSQSKQSLLATLVASSGIFYCCNSTQ
jgi:hypothetical protein